MSVCVWVREESGCVEVRPTVLDTFGLSGTDVHVRSDHRAESQDRQHKTLRAKLPKHKTHVRLCTHTIATVPCDSVAA